MHSPAAVYVGQRCKGKGKDFFGKGKGWWRYFLSCNRKKIENFFSVFCNIFVNLMSFR